MAELREPHFTKEERLAIATGMMNSIKRGDYAGTGINEILVKLVKAVEKGVTSDQLIEGQKIEMEHTTDGIVAMSIAIEHLLEHRDYYTKLKSLGL